MLLLAGVTMNAFFSALILVVQYFADFADAYRTLRWLMGDLDVSSYAPLVTALPLVLVAFAVFASLARPLNLLSLGTDSAETRGLPVARTQRAAFFSASLATGAAVSVGGPVGFVGIIIPHLVRLLVGSDHRVVLPASALFGAAFLVGCDVVARTLLAPVEIPVGIITALIGGPFFLWLLVRRGDTMNGPRPRGMNTMHRMDTKRTLCWRLGFGVALVILLLPAASPRRASLQLANIGAAPTRIISLIPAVTEMLFAMSAGPAVVAVSSFDEYPPQVKSLPRVGALLDPDLERILSLRPELVIVYESQTDLRRQLERAGIPMFVYKHAGLADVTLTIRATR